MYRLVLLMYGLALLLSAVAVVLGILAVDAAELDIHMYRVPSTQPVTQSLKPRIQPEGSQVLNLRHRKFPESTGVTADTAGKANAQIVQIQGTANRFTWPKLGQEKTIVLGEQLKKTLSGRKVTIWCSTPDCTDLAADLDDAFQIAGMPSDIDRREIDSSHDAGLFVGGPDADILAAAIAKATSINPPIVAMPGDSPLAVIIGKRKR